MPLLKHSSHGVGVGSVGGAVVGRGSSQYVPVNPLGQIQEEHVVESGVPPLEHSREHSMGTCNEYSEWSVEVLMVSIVQMYQEIY